jgi:hypothetical protein
VSDEDRLDEQIRAAASDYREPPETPREAMWERIQAARAGRELREAAARRRRRRWLTWGIGIAAVLVAGVAIGRWSAPDVSTPAATVAAGPASGPAAPTSGAVISPASDAAYRLAAAAHLDRVEVFLTQFRREAETGRVDPTLRAPARRLLSNTRLLLASPAADDPALRTVLGDVELVLVQVAQYSADPSREDLRFIDDGIEQRGLLLELRTVTTTSPVGLQQGAL